MLIDLRQVLIFLLIVVSGFSSIPPLTTPINGLIEGFYWSAANAIHDQYKSFTKKQRDQLIASMDEGMNYYFYSPQDSEDDPFTMTLWDAKTTAD